MSLSSALPHFAHRLFDLVIDLDPARTTWERLRENVRERAQKLASEIEQLLKESPEAERVRVALLGAKESLHELSEALNNGPNATRWRQLYARLAKDYDLLVRELRASRPFKDIDFRRLAPANYVRNVFHIAGGVTGALCYHYLLDRTDAILVMATFVGVFTVLEILRRQSANMNDALMRFGFFKRIARPHEYYRVNSSTYYAYGMLVAVILAPKQAVEAACLVLAFGDPLASNLGRRFGRVKLFRDKSVVGTVAFFAAAGVTLFAFQLVFYASQTVGISLLVAASGAAIGALVEAFTTRLDDNLTVPLSTALGLGILLALLGLA